MSRRRAWAAAALIAGRPPAPPTSPGRYQVQVSGRAPNSTVFVLDSHTCPVRWKQTHPEMGRTGMGTPIKGQPDKGR